MLPRVDFAERAVPDLCEELEPRADDPRHELFVRGRFYVRFNWGLSDGDFWQKLGLGELRLMDDVQVSKTESDCVGVAERLGYSCA